MRTGGEEESALKWKGDGEMKDEEEEIHLFIYPEKKEGRRKGTLCVSLTLYLSLHVCSFQSITLSLLKKIQYMPYVFTFLFT